MDFVGNRVEMCGLDAASSGSCEHGNEPLLSIQGGGFFWLTDC
jgi:hypothetical protein